MRKIAGLVALAALTFTSGSAVAAEALLIRHEVLTLAVGSELHLSPGFFIGKAWMADPEVAQAGLASDLRGVTLMAKAPGRTIVSAWNLRQPDKRIEYEIVVVDGGTETTEVPIAEQALAPKDTVSSAPDVTATDAPEEHASSTP